MRTAFNVVAAIFGFFLYRFSGDTSDQRLGFAIAMLTVSVPCIALGWILGFFLKNRIDADGTTVEVISWTSLVLWIFPPLGFAMSSLVWSWSKLTERRALQFMILSTVCGVASFVNFTVGARASIAETSANETAPTAYSAP